MFDDALIRYAGDLCEHHGAATKELSNPVRWFSTGVEQMLSIPLYFLSAFGVLSVTTIFALQRSRFFRFCSAVIVLTGLAASVISIVDDGKTALGHIKAMFGI
jgi:hypothetical protein